MRTINLDLCKGCGICVDACPNNAITIENKKPVIDMNLCLGCEVCISSCPNQAIISDRYKKLYTYRLPQPQPFPQSQNPLYYPLQFHQIYYPRSRRRRRGWRGGY